MKSEKGVGVINDQLKDNKSKADNNNETPVSHHKIVEESVEYSKGSEFEPIIEEVNESQTIIDDSKTFENSIQFFNNNIKNKSFVPNSGISYEKITLNPVNNVAKDN